jgi:hypothetical protein
MPSITRGTDGKGRANEKPAGEAFGKKVVAEEKEFDSQFGSRYHVDHETDQAESPSGVCGETSTSKGIA